MLLFQWETKIYEGIGSGLSKGCSVLELFLEILPGLSFLLLEEIIARISPLGSFPTLGSQHYLSSFPIGECSLLLLCLISFSTLILFMGSFPLMAVWMLIILCLLILLPNFNPCPWKHDSNLVQFYFSVVILQ